MSEDLVFVVGDSEGVPAGNYRGTFDRIDIVEDTEFAERAARFVFKIETGEHGGRETSVLCTVVDDKGAARKPTPKNKLGKVLAGLAGGPVEPGSQVRPAEHFGTSYLLTVEPTKSGAGTTVSTIFRDTA
jgi:hypothetical protein